MTLIPFSFVLDIVILFSLLLMYLSLSVVIEERIICSGVFSPKKPPKLLQIGDASRGLSIQ
jgi:hypothetical protein